MLSLNKMVRCSHGLGIIKLLDAFQPYQLKLNYAFQLSYAFRLSYAFFRLVLTLMKFSLSFNHIWKIITKENQLVTYHLRL